MKINISILLLVPFFIFSSKIFGQNTFKLVFGKKDESGFAYVIRAGNDGSIVFDDTDGDCMEGQPCKSGISAIFINGNGEALKFKEYVSSMSINSPKAMATTDKGFTFAGRIYDRETKKYSGYIFTKCDKQGKVSWSRHIRLSANPYLSPEIIKEDSKGGFVIESRLAENNFNSDRIHLLRLSKDGQMTWSTTIDNLQSWPNFYEPTCLEETSDGGLILGGNMNCQICEGRLTPAIMKLDKFGIPEYSKNVYSKPYNYYQSLSLDKIISDGKKIFVLGVDNDPSYRNFLLELTDTTTAYPASTFPATGHSSIVPYLRKHKHLLPFRYDNYGGYFDTDLTYVSGGYGGRIDNNVIYNAALSKFDSLDRICPDFITPLLDTITSIKWYYLDTLDFELVNLTTFCDAVAVWDTAFEQETYLYCSGEYNALAPVYTNNKSVTGKTIIDKAPTFIYPNPCKNEFVLQYTTNKKKAVNVDIFTADGSPVYHETPLAYSGLNKTVVNVSFLAAGIYFLHFNNNGHQSIIKIIKE